MTELTDYRDARAMHPAYQQSLCPQCGVTRWFKKAIPPHESAYWTCQDCNCRREHSIEYPCPECDVRMLSVLGNFQCNNANCDHRITERDKEELIDRLSSDTFPTQGKPGVFGGDCPLCDGTVNGGPDGELKCGSCSFYAGQYSAEWYCYAIWMANPDLIRVNDDG